VACHGANAEKPYLGGKVPALNTLSKEDIIASLKGYKDRTQRTRKQKNLNLQIWQNITIVTVDTNTTITKQKATSMKRR